MNRILYSIVRMFLIALFFATIVSTVKILSESRIEKNQQVKLHRTVLNILGLPVNEKSPHWEVIQVFNERVKAVMSITIITVNHFI